MNVTSIKTYVEGFGSDNLKVFGGTYEGGIHLQQVPDEISPCLYDLREFNVRNFLEIGAAAGGNTYLLNYFFGFENIILIDDNEHPKHNLREDILTDVPHKEFIGDSHSQESLDFIEGLDLKYDMIFIDADHSYDGVKMDTEMYVPFLCEGGLVLYHDIGAVEGVRRFFNEIKNENDYGLEFFDSYVSVGHKRRCGIGVMIKCI